MTTQREAGLLRVVAQRLAGPRFASAAAAAGWMTASQGQDLPGVITSIALRTVAQLPAQVIDAFNSGELVRAWPIRGTLHVVRGEDLGWLLSITGSRMLAATRGRRASLGLTSDVQDRAYGVAVAVLRGGRALSRAAVLSAWQEAGIDTAGQRGAHLIGYLAHRGVVCWGPMDGRYQLLVLVDEWLPHRRHLSDEDALGELALRFFRSHGPATVHDLARWAGITLSQARSGLAHASGQLTSIVIGKDTMYLDPATPALLAEHRAVARAVHLLPGFDEFVLGYRSTDVVLPSEHAQQVVPGGNGMYRRTVVAAGQVVGTWRPTGSGARRRAETDGFGTLSERTETAVARCFSRPPWQPDGTAGN